LPGVRGVGSSEIATLTGTDNGANITIEGKKELPEDLQHVEYDGVSPKYFSTLGVALVEGREFTESDTGNSPKVAIVNESMVKRFFPEGNALGARFAWGGGKVTPNITIVAVVKDTKQSHVRDGNVPYIYYPYSQDTRLTGMTFYVRTQQDPLLLAKGLRGEVQHLDANLPVYELKTFERVVNEDLFAERMVAGLSASFGGLAALLAALGIYGRLGVPGGAANQGDWDSNGAGREAGERAALDFPRGGIHGIRGGNRWIAAQLWAGAVERIAALRRAGGRSFDLCADPSGDWGGGGRGLLRSGEASDAGASDRGFTV